jgi:hypothetical protein
VISSLEKADLLDGGSGKSFCIRPGSDVPEPGKVDGSTLPLGTTADAASVVGSDFHFRPANRTP